jgi:hypothetical protein
MAASNPMAPVVKISLVLRFLGTVLDWVFGIWRSPVVYEAFPNGWQCTQSHVFWRHVWMPNKFLTLRWLFLAPFWTSGIRTAYRWSYANSWEAAARALWT